MGLVMEALADGGVLVGIPRPMADKIAAYTMMVRREGKRRKGFTSFLILIRAQQRW